MDTKTTANVFAKAGTLFIGLVMMLAGVGVGAVVLVLQLTSAFGAVGHSAPEDRSQLLSDGISQSFVWAAGCGGPVTVVGLGILLFGTWRLRARRQTR